MSALKRWWPLALVAVALAIVIARFWAEPPYSPDSWAYFELSRSLWSDGYVLGHARAYGTLAADAPSASFPPLWPLAWSAVGAVTRLGARSGLLLAVLAAYAFVILSEAIGRAVTATRWLGMAAALVVLLTPGFFDEIVGARSIPGQMALAATAVLVAVRRPQLGTREGAVLGALAGLMVMLRFDMLPFAAALGAAVAWLTRSWKSTLAFLGGCLLLLSPWVVMSWHFHSVWFASDNVGVALSADPMRSVTDWYPSGHYPPTAFEQPAAFVEKVRANAGRLIERMAHSPGRLVSLILLTAGALVALGAARNPRGPLAALRVDPSVRAQAKVLAAFTLAALAMLPAYLLSGYFDARYFSLSIWIGGIWLCWGLAHTWRARHAAAWLDRSALATCGFLLAALIATKTGAATVEASAFPAVPGAVALQACLRAAKPSQRGERVLADPEILAARLSAVHGVATAFTPNNFRRSPPGADLAREFFQAYRIGFVAGDSSAIAAVFPADVLEPVRGGGGGACGMLLFRTR